MNKQISIVLFFLVVCVVTGGTGYARSRATVKYSVTRLENQHGAKDFLALPFAFSSETMGTTFGIGAGARGYGQDQLLVGGAVYGGFEETLGVVLALYDFSPEWADRFFFSVIGSVGSYPRQRAYVDPLSISKGGARAGTNDSDNRDFIESGGEDNWWEMKLEWILPMGSAKMNAKASYQLENGVLVSGASGGTDWNPFEGGVTTLLIRQFNRYQSFDYQGTRYEGTVHPVEFGIGYNNTDFPINPSIGSNQFFSYIQDFGWFESKDRWNFVQFETSKYFSFSPTDRARQRTVALNFWTGHSFSWTENTDNDGHVERKNAPPYFDGAVLGGFYRMRGYANHRFHDRSVIYTSAEYRYTPRWNPLGELPFLKFLKMDWWQLVGFIEGGRVAPEYKFDALFSDWKIDGGLGIRFMMAGGVVRFDFGISDEGGNLRVMFGHPF